MINKLSILSSFLIIFIAGFGIEVAQDDITLDTNPTVTTQPKFLELIADIQDDADYAIASKIFEKDYVKISYPQIIGMADATHQASINHLIFDQIYESFSRFFEWDVPISLDIDFEIKLYSNRLLSIVYTGLGVQGVSSRPFWVFYTTNINIAAGEIVRLGDVINVDEEFIELLKSETTIYRFRISINYIYHPMLKEQVRNIMSSDSFRLWLQNTDNIEFYFTAESLGIGIDSLGHAAGTHAQLEISYDHLFQKNAFQSDSGHIQ